MKKLVLMLGLLFFATAGFSEPAVVKPTTTLKAFVGKWTGQWDKTWAVNFVVRYNADKTALTADYTWEEDPGKPMHHRKHTCKLEGDVLKVGSLIEITLSPNRSEQSQSRGTFFHPKNSGVGAEKVGKKATDSLNLRSPSLPNPIWRRGPGRGGFFARDPRPSLAKIYGVAVGSGVQITFTCGNIACPRVGPACVSTT